MNNDEHPQAAIEKASQELFKQSNVIGKLQMLDFPLDKPFAYPLFYFELLQSRLIPSSPGLCRKSGICLGNFSF